MKDLSRFVGRVVIYYNNVKGEGGFLRQSALYGIGNRFLTVKDRDDNRCLYLELLFVEVGHDIISRAHQCSYLLEMCRNGLFHLYLHIAVGGVHIVELLLPAGTKIAFLLGI